MIHEFSIYTENARLKEMGVDEKRIAKLAIDLNEINAIWENASDENDDIETTICLKDGCDYTVKQGYNEVFSIWSNFKKSVTQ